MEFEFTNCNTAAQKLTE